MEAFINQDQVRLEDKLRLLAEGEEAGLTAAEAAIYGVDYADEDTDLETAESGEEEDNE